MLGTLDVNYLAGDEGNQACVHRSRFSLDRQEFHYSEARSGVTQVRGRGEGGGGDKKANNEIGTLLPITP